MSAEDGRAEGNPMDAKGNERNGNLWIRKGRSAGVRLVERKRPDQFYIRTSSLVFPINHRLFYTSISSKNQKIEITTTNVCKPYFIVSHQSLSKKRGNYNCKCLPNIASKEGRVKWPFFLPNRRRRKKMEMKTEKSKNTSTHKRRA
jgi:hypothetical protein